MRLLGMGGRTVPPRNGRQNSPSSGNTLGGAAACRRVCMSPILLVKRTYERDAGCATVRLGRRVFVQAGACASYAVNDSSCN